MSKIRGEIAYREAKIQSMNEQAQARLQIEQTKAAAENGDPGRRSRIQDDAEALTDMMSAPNFRRAKPTWRAWTRFCAIRS